MKLNGSTVRSGEWTIVLTVATLISLVFFGQAYFSYVSMKRPFHWEEHVLWTFTSWYIWAAFFPLVLRLARRFRYDSSTLVRSIAIHVLAGIVIALVHAIIQMLIVYWLFHPERTFAEVVKISREHFIPVVFWRFTIYHAILAVCYAWDYYRRARETELNSVHLEESIARAQMQALKMQLEPKFLFRSLNSLPSLMHTDLRSADRLVARLGDYLRMTLDNALKREIPLSKELDFVRCTVEIEKIHDPSAPSIQLQIASGCLDWPVPNRSIQPAVEAMLKRNRASQQSPDRILIEANSENDALSIQIHDPHPLKNSAELESLRTSIDASNGSREKDIGIQLQERSDGISAILKIESEANGTKIKDGATSERKDKPQVEEPPEPLVNPIKRWGIIVGSWTALAVYFMAMDSSHYIMSGKPVPWAKSLLDSTTWFLWALLTPFIFGIARKYPLRRGLLLRNVTIHAMANAACWFYTGFGIALISWITSLAENDIWHYMSAVFKGFPFSLDILVYWTAVALASATSYRRHYMFGQIRASKLNAQLARAQLQALKMQLHPHFLFNTLNSISELMQEDTEAAEKMLSHLEHFLHLTVNNSEAQEVPFEQELEFLKCYLAIEHVRFQDRLSIQMDIAPETLSIAVPNLLLQPIVENAIRHGIAPRTSPGKIEIRAKRNNGILHVCVQDNGPGLTDDQRKTAPLKKGLGLSNTRERLQQLYGKEHRFELDNAPEGGLVVTLEIPDQNRVIHEIKAQFR